MTGDEWQVTRADSKSLVTRHVSRVTRYGAIYAALWKTSVTREMSFKGNFVLWILVELAWFGLQLAFVGVIFSQTRTVGTWTVWQVVLLTGTSNFIQELIRRPDYRLRRDPQRPEREVTRFQDSK